MNNNAFKITVRIDDKDVIAPYNHVHHAQILRYLEEARNAWTGSIGFSMESWFARKLFPVVRGIEIEYLREIRVGEYQVYCQTPIASRRNLLMTQEIVNSLGKTMVQASVDLMFFDSNLQRAVPLPADFLAAI